MMKQTVSSVTSKPIAKKARHGVSEIPSSVQNNSIKLSDITTDMLDTELLNVDDLFGRALCPYFLLGETARSIKSNKLEGDKIEVGTYARNVTKPVMDVFNDYITGDDIIINDTGFSYTSHNGVPVECVFLQTTYPFLDSPDFEFYHAGEYNVPNQFEVYWPMRDKLE